MILGLGRTFCFCLWHCAHALAIFVLSSERPDGLAPSVETLEKDGSVTPSRLAEPGEE